MVILLASVLSIINNYLRLDLVDVVGIPDALRVRQTHSLLGLPSLFTSDATRRILISFLVRK